MTEHALTDAPDMSQPAIAVLLGAALGALAFALAVFLFGATFGIVIAAFAAARVAMRGKRIAAGAFALVGVSCAFAYHGSTVAVLLGAFAFLIGLALASEHVESM